MRKTQRSSGLPSAGPKKPLSCDGGEWPPEPPRTLLPDTRGIPQLSQSCSSFDLDSDTHHSGVTSCSPGAPCPPQLMSPCDPPEGPKGHCPGLLWLLPRPGLAGALLAQAEDPGPVGGTLKGSGLRLGWEQYVQSMPFPTDFWLGRGNTGGVLTSLNRQFGWSSRTAV